MAITHHHNDYEMYGPDTRRMASSFKRERTWKIAAALGSVALVAGGLLAAASGEFHRGFDLNSESAPAMVNPGSDTTGHGSGDTSGSLNGMNPGTDDTGRLNGMNPGSGDQNNVDQMPGVDTSGSQGNADQVGQGAVPGQGTTGTHGGVYDTDRDTYRWNDTNRGNTEGNTNNQGTDDTGMNNGVRGGANDGTNPGSSAADSPPNTPNSNPGTNGTNGTNRLPPEGYAPR